MSEVSICLACQIEAETDYYFPICVGKDLWEIAKQPHSIEQDWVLIVYFVYLMLPFSPFFFFKKNTCEKKGLIIEAAILSSQFIAF